jgi:hypothetical protein
MSSRTLTGLLLIVGPIVLFGSFIVIGVCLGTDLDWGDASVAIPALGENAGFVKAIISVATLGMLMVAAGFAGLNDSMSGGSSAHYMRVGLLFYIIGAAVVIGESALTIGTAEAASDGNQAVAGTFFAASTAIGAVGEAIRFLGFAVMGASILVQKNLHVALGALMVVIGLIGVGMSMADYTSDFMLIGYAGAAILTLATGVLVIRAKN